MKELSIFIDESGDFGPYNHISPFYIIGLVIHDQSKDITSQINTLDSRILNTPLKRKQIHIGPLIRREAEYKYMTIKERSTILRYMVTFAKNVDFRYEAIIVNKKEVSTEVELASRLTIQLSGFIKENLGFFNKYDVVKIYYDNGQSGVVKIIVAVFTALFGRIEFKNATQEEYKMLQVADLICTATLTELKMDNKTLSKSERNLLGNDRNIRQKLLKPLSKKRFEK